MHLIMSILCCFRRRQSTCEEPDQGLVQLPTHPPAAKLPKPPVLTAGVDSSSSPPIVVTQPPSLLHNQIPEATVDPTTLEVEDSDDDEPAPSARNSSTGTLEAFRTKFIRRMSEGSGSKRHSQQSLGTSEEEIARRAELKRLMHKRIQEELKSEEEQDEEIDAKITNLEVPKLADPIRAELPGGGPRDNIEFSVSDVSEAGSKEVNDPLDIVLLPLPPSDSYPVVSLRKSSTSRSYEDLILKNRATLKERASLPQLPSSPQLAAVHLPSIQSSESFCSWQLSYSAERIVSYLGAPSESKTSIELGNANPNVQERGVDERDEEKVGDANIGSAEKPCRQESSSTHGLQHDQNNTETLEDRFAEASPDMDSSIDSPLDLWLRSQEMQSNSAVSSRRTSDMILQMIPDSFDSRLRQSGDIDEPLLIGRVRNTSNSSSIIPHYPPDVWSNSRGLQADTAINPAELQGAESKEQQQPTRDFSSASDGTNHTRNISSSHYASSRYTTRPNSSQTTAKEPRLSLVELLGGRRAISNFNRLISPSRTTDADKSKSDVSSYKTAHNEASAMNITLGEIRMQQHLIDETGSALFSDTESFKHREAELKSIEKRFGQSKSRRDVTVPIVSKFREEFVEPRAPATTKSSIFSKFHLSIKKAKPPAEDIRLCSRSVDNLISAFNRIGLHGIDKLPVTAHESGREFPGIGHEEAPDPQHNRWDSPKDKQGREGAQANQKVGVSTCEVETIDPGRTVSGDKVACVTDVLDPQSRMEYGQSLKPPSRPEDGSSPSQQSDISNSVLREWVNLMNGEDSHAHAEPKSKTQKRSPLRFKTPPASWAKWPSHTRHERNGPAGERDDVISRDFAVRVGSNGSGTSWSTDKPNDSPKRYIAPETRSLSAQVGRVVKGSISKVTQGTLNRDRTSADTTQEPQKSYGHLEYPELEILPMNGGYKELQALEQQIDTLKRGSVAAENQLAPSSSNTTRPPLSARLASEVHMIQHTASRDSCKDDKESVAISMANLPLTPRQLLLDPYSASEGNVVPKTPSSQVSYEDCVPKHMLEDERSVKDEAIAEHGKGIQTV